VTRDQAADVVALLFEESYHALTRYAYRRTGDLDTAEELVQEVLMALFAELRRSKLIEHPKAWCLVVLQRKIHKERRRVYGAPHQSFEDIEGLEGSVGDDGLPSPEPDDVRRLLGHLTKREQEVMLLRMESLKYREIAKVLGISKNTVNALLARGLGKLQALVRRQELEGSLTSRYVEKNITKTLQ